MPTGQDPQREEGHVHATRGLSAVMEIDERLHTIMITVNVAFPVI